MYITRVLSSLQKRNIVPKITEYLPNAKSKASNLLIEFKHMGKDISLRFEKGVYKGYNRMEEQAGKKISTNLDIIKQTHDYTEFTKKVNIEMPEGKRYKPAETWVISVEPKKSFSVLTKNENQSVWNERTYPL